MTREWPVDMPDSRKRRILLESIERHEALLVVAEADHAAAEKKLKPVRDRERAASSRVWSLRERLLEERAALKELVTDPEADAGVPVDSRSKR